MVCVVKVSASFAVGDMIRIRSQDSEWTQKVESLQIESVNVKQVQKGQLVGLKVTKPCREGGLLYRLNK